MEETEGRKEKSFPMAKVVDAARVLDFPDNSTNLEDSDESRRSTRGTCLAILDLVNHALIVGLTGYTLYHSWGSNVVNLHTIFCTIGVCISRSIIKHFSKFPRFKIIPLGFHAISSTVSNASSRSVTKDRDKGVPQTGKGEQNEEISGWNLKTVQHKLWNWIREKFARTSFAV